MIGAGIFGTTGQIAQQLPSAPVILTCWVIGALMALCGALSYGELVGRFPRSGGEYHYLRTLFHPALGFASGVVSLVAGFSASIAFNASIFGEYVATIFLGVNAAEDDTTLFKKIVAVGLVLLLTTLHAFSVQIGAAIQNTFTLFKIGLLLVFIFGGFFVIPTENITDYRLGFDWSIDGPMFLTADYGGALINVFYGYLGWNAAAYVTNEIDNPRKNVPLALLYGTVLVAVLYLLINLVFFRAIPMNELQGKAEAGALAAVRIYGSWFGQALTALIALALVSSSSSMIMAGPRVTEAMGSDFRTFRLLTTRVGGSGPLYALGLQAALTIYFILAANYFTILGLIGFLLTLFSGLTVLGLFIARSRAKEPYTGFKVPLYPVVPAIYLVLAGFMGYSSVVGNLNAVLIGTLTLVVALGIFTVLERWEAKQSKQ